MMALQLRSDVFNFIGFDNMIRFLSEISFIETLEEHFFITHKIDDKFKVHQLKLEA